MKKETKTILIISFSILGLLLLAAGYLIYTQHKALKQNNDTIEEMTAVMEFEKQQSIEEFEQMQKQYEDFYINTDNDSLLRLIDEEKQKVQQLLQELKTVKATNTRRISELKHELTTVRSVLKTYVAKVDSLNTVNDNLRTENKKIRGRYEEQERQLQEKTAQANALEEKISMASILEASDITISALNEKGKKSSSLKKTAKLQIDFKILRNISAERGHKTIYLRITDSKENLLPTSAHDYFIFEGVNLEYSAKKDYDFSGETQEITMYFPIMERLVADIYTITIFTEGNLIGQRSFKLQ